jgi:pyruvate formate lyase activating enzyme
MEQRALIFDIKRDSSEDGPGIRTTVFFKGCPLSCVWCQNPEGLERSPGLAHRVELCTPESCGVPCVAVCAAGALHLQDGKLQVEHAACTRCDLCFDVCPTQALEPVGTWITVDELRYRVAVDQPFYRATGGGVTVSGGEATGQMQFLHTFLQRLKQDSIHTALETSGLFNYRHFRQLLLPYLDLIYFDIKLIDDAASRRYSGVSNRPILANFAQLLKDATIPVIVRVPLIPGITTTRENLQGIAQFLRAHGVHNAVLLPYNPLWQDKLARLGASARYPRRSFMTQQEIAQCLEYMPMAAQA